MKVVNKKQGLQSLADFARDCPITMKLLMSKFSCKYFILITCNLHSRENIVTIKATIPHKSKLAVMSNKRRNKLGVKGIFSANKKNKEGGTPKKSKY